MRVLISDIPEQWRRHFLWYSKEVSVDDAAFEKFREEANSLLPELTDQEKHAWAVHAALTHPGFKPRTDTLPTYVDEASALPKSVGAPRDSSPLPKSVGARRAVPLLTESRLRYFLESAWKITILPLLAAILVLRLAHCQTTSTTTTTPAVAHAAAPTYSEGARVPLWVDLSGRLQIPGSAGGTSLGDLGTFTQGTTSFTPAGCLFNTTITNMASGQAGAFQCTTDRMLFVNIGKIAGTAPTLTGSSLNVNCTGGCGSSTFADNSVFTAGTSSITNIGGVFNDALAAVTSGNAAAPRITSDRALFINLFKVGGAAITLGQNTMANSLPVAFASNQSNLGVTQATSPWVNNITQWNSVALGSPSAYGTSPGAVNVPGVNAFITNTPAVSQSGTWTVQPGNTANTTAWLVTGTGGTFPVSDAFVNLFNAASATATATSSTVRVSTFGGFGTLYTTYAGITGSPAGCTVQLKNADSLGNLINNGAAISTTPANGTTSTAFNSGANLQTTDEIQAVYNCTTFPTAGTISLDYAPGVGVGLLASLPSGANTIGAISNTSFAATQSGTWTVQPGNTANTTAWLVTGTGGTFPIVTWAGGTLGAMANYGTSPGAVLVPGVNAFITNTPTVTANAGSGTFTVGGTVTANAGTGNFNVVGTQATNSVVGNGVEVLPGRFDTTLPTLTSGNAALIALNSNGEVRVVQPTAANLNATVSGTVTANAGTGNFNVVGTQATNSVVGNGLEVLPGRFDTTLPALTSGNAALLALNSNGEVRVVQPTAANLNTTVTGTVTANAGTGNFNVAGTQATNSVVGNALEVLPGRFDTTLPTLTSGNAALLALNSNGEVRVVQPTAANLNATVTGIVTANAGTGNFNNSGSGSTGSAVPTGAQYVAGNGSGNLTGLTVCDHWQPINQASTTAVTLITGTASKQTYICSINLVVAGANNVALVEGTAAGCGTGTAGMAGGATAATGWNFAANGGLTHGSAIGAVFRTATAADNVCVLQSAATQVSGSLTWTQF